MTSILYKISKIKRFGNKFLEQKLKEEGLESLYFSHGDILSVLFSDKDKDWTLSEISKKISRTKATLTVLANKLESEGYAKRVKDSKNFKKTYLKLTDKGKELEKTFDKISAELEEYLIGSFNKTEVEEMEKSIDKLLLNLEKDKD